MNESSAARMPPPGEAERLFDEGRRAHLAGRLEDAMAGYRAALRLDPTHGGALNNLGVALKTLNRFAPAIACYRRGLALKPDDAGLLTNLGNALRGLGRFAEAEAVLKRALSLNPGSVDALNNLSLSRKAERRFKEAIEGLTEVLRHRPDDPETHLDLALTLLQVGEFERGFVEYEWRFRSKELPPRGLAEPLWDGAPLEGRTILLYTEQGYGDCIQFVRYAPLVAARGGRVVIECQPPLVRLFQRVEGVAEVVARGEALPRFDLQAPILSLPRIFGTTMETIPAPARYVSPPPKLAYDFRKRVRAPDGMLKVGLVWAGKPTQKNNHNRSAGFPIFIDLLGTPGTAWFSLQVGDRAGDVETHHCGGLIDDLTPEIEDFADSAAAIDALDLLVTVDTGPAHLAGALGKPIWLALAYAGDWHYPEGDGSDSPWYPSMRVFRQDSFGDWKGVVARIQRALEAREGLRPVG
ncbi:MAG: tetratricopeptide repeat protein [Alphaproteobacteria bacterium]